MGSQGKCRSLRVIFPTSDAALHVIKNKSKLINSKIKISSDNTKMQLEHLQNLRTELQQRQINGESNLTIKYVKGVPKIIYIYVHQLWII